MTTRPTGAMGTTRCPGCEKRFIDTPTLTAVDIDGMVYTRGRPGYKHGNAGRPVPGRITWHQECLAEFEAQNERLRAEVERDRQRTSAKIGVSAGMSDESLHYTLGIPQDVINEIRAENR